MFGVVAHLDEGVKTVDGLVHALTCVAMDAARKHTDTHPLVHPQLTTSHTYDRLFMHISMYRYTTVR